MRVSSVILRSLSRGTLRSQRTNTVLPSRSAFLRSPTDFFFASTLSAARACARTEVFLALTEDLAKNARAERAGAAAKAAIVVVFGCWGGSGEVRIFVIVPRRDSPTVRKRRERSDLSRHWRFKASHLYNWQVGLSGARNP